MIDNINNTGMNPVRIKTFAVTLFLILFFWETANADGYLRADGQAIVNEQGDKVILRGMGLGGWMLQEGYMLQLGNLGQQHVIKSKISELIGPEATQEFYNAWLANHTRKADIDAMAKWGFNSIRLPMHYELFTLPVDQEPVKGQNTWLPKGFELTDALLAWCKANNIYLILDLHAAPGGQGNDIAISDRDPNKPSLWQSPENQQKTIALWQKLAERYVNEPWIGAYDIINEPNWGFESADDKHGCKEQKNEPVKKLMMDITKTIRAVDTKHMLVIEGNCWGNNYSGILPTWDSNTVLSFHKYWNNNNLGEIDKFLKLREKYNVPIWLGESGENSDVWYTDVIRMVESQGIGWAFWPLKKLGFNNPLQVPVNPGYTKIVEYLNGKGEKPSAADAKKALMQLTQDLRFENNIYHPEVIDAMFRQPHSMTSLPFKPHTIQSKATTINAVDYDMGVNAYVDSKSGDYHVSVGGDFDTWNNGKVYRNDGVDIGTTDTKNKNLPAYFVTDIANDEWLQYTINVEKAGDYRLSVQVKSEKGDAMLAVILNNLQITTAAKISQTSDWKTQKLTTLNLVEGTNTLRLKAVSGGYQLATLVFEH